MEYKVKILKDTPFDREGESITLKEFRNRYGYVFTDDTSDSELVEFLKTERKLQLESPFHHQIGDWFEVIELSSKKFSMGDWVWHEQLKSAFCVMPYIPNDQQWRPNHVSFDAANNNVDIYKRKATQAEINDADLMSYLDGAVLIGRTRAYYHDNVYKEINGIQRTISLYIQKTNHLPAFKPFDFPSDDRLNGWSIQFLGLKVGCKEIPHEDIIKMAKFLRIIL